MNICDSFQGRMYQTDCNQVGHSRQLLCLLTSKISPLHAAVAPTSIKTPQKITATWQVPPTNLLRGRNTGTLFTSPSADLSLPAAHRDAQLLRVTQDRQQGRGSKYRQVNVKRSKEDDLAYTTVNKWNKTCSHSYCTKNLLPDVWQHLEAPLGVRAASMRQFLFGRRAICALSFLCSRRRSLILVHAVKALPERRQVQTLRRRWLTCLNLALASFSFILPWATR